MEKKEKGGKTWAGMCLELHGAVRTTWVDVSVLQVLGKLRPCNWEVKSLHRKSHPKLLFVPNAALSW